MTGHSSKALRSSQRCDAGLGKSYTCPTNIYTCTANRYFHAHRYWGFQHDYTGTNVVSVRDGGIVDVAKATLIKPLPPNPKQTMRLAVIEPFTTVVSAYYKLPSRILTLVSIELHREDTRGSVSQVPGGMPAHGHEVEGPEL